MVCKKVGSWLTLAITCATFYNGLAQGLVSPGEKVLGMGAANNQVSIKPDNPVTSSKADHRVGRLPAMGWNSWNHFKCDVHEQQILDMANKFIELGLKDAGYEYINIDDCWSVRGQRDPKTDYIIPDPKKFPSGISGLAKKVHALGLKIGIYSSAGTVTCEGYPASLEREETDAKSFAEWGIDYLKYDNCGIPPEWQDECEYCQKLNGTCTDKKYCPPGYDYTKSNTVKRYNAMRDALKKQTRPILYSLCQWGRANVHTWGGDTAPSWRSTEDIENTWKSVLAILNQNSFQLAKVDFYNHADPDMLEVGNRAGPGLTHNQERTHFALWAAMKSPLLIGANLNDISRPSLDILKTKTLIAFNQDEKFGLPAIPFNWDWKYNNEKPAQFWAGRYSDGLMIFLFNNENSNQNLTFSAEKVNGIEQHKVYAVTDAWNGADYGTLVRESTVVVEIAEHDTAVLILREQSKVKRGTYMTDLLKRHIVSFEKRL